MAFLTHRLPHITIYHDQSYAALRVGAFAVCLVLMILSWPKFYSSRGAILLLAVLVIELILYFRPVPIDPIGIGEATAGFLPFWLMMSLLNFLIVPAAVGLLIYAFVHHEKTSYLTFAASFLVFLVLLFPFEQICRWGTYALM